MKNKQYSRRSLFKISSASLGGVLIGSKLGFAANWQDKKELLSEIIYKNVPNSINNKKQVEAFIDELLSSKLESLEEKDFIDKEMGKFDQRKLERYIVTQYLISEHYQKAL